MKLRSKIEKINPALLLGAVAILIVVFLTARNWGVYATIMWDEWEYSRYARLLPLSGADVPYYLYYSFYGLTKFCGDRFLGCAQILNALFFAASLPFIYLVCRRTASQTLSILIAVASILGGVSVYAAHFMPEPMYFCGFWIWAWAMLNAVDRKADHVWLGVGAGCALALLSLVKLHALFLVPGVTIYFFLCSLTPLGAGGIRGFAKSVSFMLVTFFAVRLLSGYAIAGDQGLNILGAVYHDRAQTMVSSAPWVEKAIQSWPFFAGNVLAIVSMYAIPCLLMGTIHLRPADSCDEKILSLQFLFWSLLLPLLAVVAFYTAQVSLADPEIEGAGGLLRLHLRYYNFLFPFFPIITAAVMERREERIKFDMVKAAVAAAVGGLIFYFLCHLGDYELSIADGPELRGFATLRAVAYALTAATFISLAAWVWSAKRAAKIYLLIFFPVFTLMGASAAAYSAHKETIPNAYHRAGLFARGYLRDGIGDMTVIGSDYAGAYQAMFYADDPTIAYKNKVPEHSCLNFTSSQAGKSWALLVGAYDLRTRYG